MTKTNLAVPVTIITGFLGAGKTTFINHLITKKPGYKIAILENEFGEVSIDQELLQGGKENIFEVNGGCICCTVNDKLIAYLLELLQRGQQEFDHLIVESSGVAEPLSIAEPFLSHPLIQQRYRLDAIICLVDSEHVAAQLQEEEVVARQLAAADVLVCTKTDAVAADRLLQLEEMLGKINPFARLYRARHGHTASHVDMLQLEAHQPGRLEQLQQEVPAGHEYLHQNITSCSISLSQPLDYEKFYQWAATLLRFQNSHIYRIKGVLDIKGEAEKIIFQSVRDKFVLSKGSAWPEAASSVRNSRLVFIGHALNKERLLRHLRQCVAKV